jgi:protein SCO1/2
VAERRRVVALVPLLLAAVLVLAGCGGGGAEDGDVVTGVSGGDTDGMNGVVLDRPYELPDGTLTDASGRPFPLRESLDADLTLVFFGYTSCPDICQAVMADLASARARLDTADAERTAVWFVTTDPARDDPATLREYIDRFDPEFEGVTGELADILDVAEAVHVPVEKGPRLPTGGYEVTHGTPVLGVRPDGTVPILWTEGTSAARLAEDVQAVLDGDVPSGEEG